MTGKPAKQSRKYLNYLRNVLVAGIIYFLLARLGLQVATINHNASPVWPASGFALFILEYFGISVWPGILIGAFAANLGTEVPFVAICGIALGNTLETIAAVLLMRLVRRSQAPLVVKIETIAVVSAGLVATIVSSTIGNLALLLTQALPPTLFAKSWITWWGGDTIGIWVIAPILLEIFRKQTGPTNLRRPFFSNLLIFLVLAALGAYLIASNYNWIFIFLLFPLVLFATWRTTVVTALLLNFLFCIFCVVVTIFGQGPFRGGSINENMLNLQLLIAAVTLTTLVLNNFKDKVSLRRSAITLMIGWFLSSVFYFTFYRNEANKNEARFEALVQQALSNVKGNLALYENALRGSVGLFYTGTDVTPQQWNAYVTALDLENVFPGINGLGVIFNIESKDLSAFQNKIRHFGIKDFNIHSVANGDQTNSNYIIAFIEPTDKNLPALGLNIASETKRREAAEMARDTGQMTSTSVIYLVQGNRPGFLFFLPFYKTKVTPDTLELRRSQFRGWIYTPVFLDNFLASALREQLSSLSVWVFSGSGTKKDDLIFSSTNKEIPTSFKQVTTLKMGLKIFTFGWNEGPKYQDSREGSFAWLGFICAILTLLLATFLVALETINIRASLIAHEKTTQLRLLLRINEHLLNSRNNSHLLEEVLKTLCRELGWDIGVFWVLNLEKTSLHFSNFYSEASPRFKEFEAAIRPLLFQNFEDFPGNVWSTQLPVHITQIKSRPTPRQPFFANANISACMAFPVRSRHGAIGVIELFAVHPPQVNTELIKTLGDVGLHIGEFLESVRTEQALEIQKQRLIETAKMTALGEMSGGIAHEINNPLTVIQGRMLQLQRTIEEGTTEKEAMLKATRVAIQMVERITKIIKGLRSFSRNSEGDPFAEASLHQIIENTLQLCSERFRNRGVDLRVKSAPGLTLLCREAQISQVILNLLNNAFDAIERSEGPWVQLETKDLGSKIEISVTDSGPGIPPAIAEKLMQPFFTTKEVGKGTGLGLSICVGIIESHGGTLKLDRESKNTRFVIQLPEPPQQGSAT